MVVLFAAPLYFANAGHFRSQIDGTLDRATGILSLLVLDVVGMHDIDYTGAGVLKDVLDELDRQHVTFAMARAGSHLRENLAQSGLLQRIGRERLFPSVDDAVRALGLEERTP